MTPNPRNELIYAPSRSLMAHRSTHFARFRRKRTRAGDVRTREIDDRTRLGDEGTRDLRSNPRGQIDAGSSENEPQNKELAELSAIGDKSLPRALASSAPDLPNEPMGYLTGGKR